jgi:cytidylate kinase
MTASDQGRASAGRETMERGRTPVIAIDGPAASGKGTVALGAADQLGFHYLESGSLYRLVGLAALQDRISLDDEERVAEAARALEAAFDGGRIRLRGADVTDAIRSEAVGSAASRVAVFPAVRTALLSGQRAFRRPPGLVAEGRDMGTVVFPDALVKIYVTATPEARAKRRYNQLIEKGNSVTMEGLLRDIRERDARDSAREVAPLRAAADAIVLDTTDMTVGESVAFVLEKYRAAIGKAGR